MSLRPTTQTETISDGTTNPGPIINGNFDALEALCTELVGPSTVDLTASRSLVSGDSMKSLVNTGADDYTITIPLGFSGVTHFRCEFLQLNTGAITIAAAGGVTIVALGGLVKSSGAGARMFLKRVGTNVYHLSGDRSA